MSNLRPPVTWARRVPQHKIRRLYLSDARGVLDEELIDDVGYAFFARCQSILTVTKAALGRVQCPECGTEIPHLWQKEKPLQCGGCDWRTTWGEYLKTYQGKQLFGGAAHGSFKQFAERWPGARTPHAKMLLIDRLIHTLHTNDRVPWARPAAVNLIEGKMKDTMVLLTELAYGDLSTPGLGPSSEAWQKAIESSQAWLAERARERPPDRVEAGEGGCGREVELSSKETAE